MVAEKPSLAQSIAKILSRGRNVRGSVSSYFGGGRVEVLWQALPCCGNRCRLHGTLLYEAVLEIPAGEVKSRDIQVAYLVVLGRAGTEMVA